MAVPSVNADPITENKLRSALRTLPLGGIRFFERSGSTNDIASDWASSSAPDLGLVYSEEQNSGRGRLGNTWFASSGAGLTFSLIFKPVPGEEMVLPLYTVLGAMAVIEALTLLGVQAEIKWPNDVLVKRRKCCGVLAESIWLGETLASMVVGIGINVHQLSVPPSESVNFPVTCLDVETGTIVDRLSLLRDTLGALIRWRSLISDVSFLKTWEEHLAFRNEVVEITLGNKLMVRGMVSGLGKDGSLRLQTPDGGIQVVQNGEIHLRPVV